MKPLSPLINRFRIVTGPLATDREAGNNGAFKISMSHRAPNTPDLFVILSDEAGWEHASVSVAAANRCPTWDEMAYIKDMFWAADETVIQIHPPQSLYVSLHKYVLHLWRPIDVPIPLPPTWTIGPVGKEADTLEQAQDAMRWAKNHPNQAYPDLPAGKKP